MSIAELAILAAMHDLAAYAFSAVFWFLIGCVVSSVVIFGIATRSPILDGYYSDLDKRDGRHTD